jgi:hypothetical protein
MRGIPHARVGRGEACGEWAKCDGQNFLGEGACRGDASTPGILRLAMP